MRPDVDEVTVTSRDASTAGGRPSETGTVPLLVLIVCYRAVDLTIDALASLEPEIPTVPGSRVIVCENGTGDGAAETLAAAVAARDWGEWVEIQAISPNRGFSGGNNHVLEDLLTWPEPPESVLLLNADTIVRPGALRVLHDAMTAHPQAGILSPRLEWPDGTPQISCFRDFHPLSELDRAAASSLLTRLLARWVTSITVADEVTRPHWTSFACALLTRDVLETVGVLDPGYFLYFDDPDYCRRARGAGFEVVNVPAARVVHLRGRSNPAKELGRQRKRRPWYHYASRTRYYFKHYGRMGLLAANLAWHVGNGLNFLRRLVRPRPAHACEKEWRDLWTNWRDPLAMPTRSQDDRAS